MQRTQHPAHDQPLHRERRGTSFPSATTSATESTIRFTIAKCYGISPYPTGVGINLLFHHPRLRPSAGMSQIFLFYLRFHNKADVSTGIPFAGASCNFRLKSPLKKHCRRTQASRRLSARRRFNVGSMRYRQFEQKLNRISWRHPMPSANADAKTLRDATCSRKRLG